MADEAARRAEDLALVELLIQRIESLPTITKHLRWDPTHEDPRPRIETGRKSLRLPEPDLGRLQSLSSRHARRTWSLRPCRSPHEAAMDDLLRIEPVDPITNLIEVCESLCFDCRELALGTLEVIRKALVAAGTPAKPAVEESARSGSQGLGQITASGGTKGAEWNARNRREPILSASLWRTFVSVGLRLG
jgi:hypothetical protein